MSVHDDIYAAVHRAMEENDDQVKGLKVAIEERNTLISQHAEEVRELTARNDERLDQAEEEKGELEARLNARTVHMDELIQDAERAAINIKHLENARKSLEERIELDKAKIVRDSQEVVDALEADIISLKRQHDAYVDKTDKEIKQLNIILEAAVKESGSELDHWKRENERLIDERNKNASSLKKEIASRDAEIQSLISDRAKLAQKHEETLEAMKGQHEGIVSHHVSDLRMLRAELQSLRELYQAERTVVQKVWDTLGYSEPYSTAKPVEELIRDKDAEIASLQKSRETLAYEHKDQTVALKSEVARLNARHEIMETTIRRYNGLRDQSDALVRAADLMEREQWSGSKPEVAEMIAELRQKVVLVR